MRTCQTIAIMATVAGLALTSATTVHAQTGQRGFSVVLVLGETQGASGAESSPPPPAVRRALTDVKDFLPYKSYRLLETGWVAGSKGGTGRLHGLDDQEYDIEIVADKMMQTPVTPKPDMLNVVFKLQEVGAATTPGEEFARSMAAANMELERANIQRRLNEGGKGPGPGVQELEAKVAEMTKQIRMARARRLMDSRFEMAIGETVVVGTSKIGGGDKGLVVLLTAVPAGSK
jgi:hypothetical protein